MNTPALTLVAHTGERVTHPTGEIPPDAPSYGQALALLAEQEDKLAGYRKTVDKQAHALGRLEREVEGYAKAEEHHPRQKDLEGVVCRWRRATNHPNAKISKDRLDLGRARLKESYEIAEMELAVDGVGAFPFVRNGKRVREGTPAECHDRLGIVLGGGESLEKFANLGAIARKNGWVTWEDES